MLQPGMTGNAETFSSVFEDIFEKVYITGRARESGQYMCTACNSIGCNSNNRTSMANIHVTGKRSSGQLRVHGALWISCSTSTDLFTGMELQKTRPDNPIEGESFNLTCSVSIYNFTKEISWWRFDINGTKAMPIDLKTQIPGKSK